MKTDTYFQKFKTKLVHGVRIIAVLALPINSIILLFLAIGLNQAAWDVDFIEGVILSLFIIAPFLLISFLGIAIISLIISSDKQLSNIKVFILGAAIGLIIVAIGNYVSSLFELVSYEFTALPSIFTIFLLAYSGYRMNSQVHLDSKTELEFRVVSRMALFAFAGSVVFVLVQGRYFDVLDIYISLGYTLSISLPVAILAGFLIGFRIKKIQTPA